MIEVIIFSGLGGLLSLSGGLFLLADKKRALGIAKYATPFAAGALLAAAFTDLLPETAHVGSVETGLQYTLVGILIFFALERFLRWFHHHHDEDDTKHNDPTIPLIVVGDTLHNFIDGIAIAAGFLIDVNTGIIVTLAVAFHEIPQEIGDFGLLLKKGMRRRNVLIVNALSAVATVTSAVIFYQLGLSVSLPLDALLGMVAGFFVYIAVSDIIPDIHEHEARSKAIAGPQTLLLLLGVLVVALSTNYLHSYIDAEDHDHETGSSVHTKEHDKHDGDEVHEEDEDHLEDADHAEDEHPIE